MPQVLFLSEPGEEKSPGTRPPGKGAAITRSITVGEGTTALEAARLAGLVIESPCNGSGVCEKCRVRIGGETVLACRRKITSDTEVVLPEREDDASLRILSGGNGFVYEKDPFITKRFTGNRTEVYGGETLLGVEEGDTAAERYGLALDIGTTTLVLSLVDLGSGNILATAPCLNPQALHAQDVLGRIRFASKEENGLAVLYGAFHSAVETLLEDLVRKTGVRREHIYEAVYSGNTTMLHLAAGIDPAPLGQYPYTPRLAGGEHISAEKLRISPFGLIWLPPFVSAWVGADIVSGILASALDERKGTTLFIDIGTNGEMVLARDGKLAASSTAAGPAFEGMNISCGMRASRGAVESFAIDGENCSFTVIGGGEAKGICGSGLLDIAGELARTGIIGRNGRFVKPEEYGGGLAARLRPPEGTAAGGEGGRNVFRIAKGVYLSQKDIRQIQLAKGAIRSGIEMLLHRFGIGPAEVGVLEIAGSFGYHLRESSLLDTGLLPGEFAGKVRFAGNTSLTGAAAFLLNRGFRPRMKALAAQVENIELSEDPEFEKNFIRYMGF